MKLWIVGLFLLTGCSTMQTYQQSAVGKANLNQRNVLIVSDPLLDPVTKVIWGNIVNGKSPTEGLPPQKNLQVSGVDLPKTIDSLGPYISPIVDGTITVFQYYLTKVWFPYAQAIGVPFHSATTVMTSAQQPSIQNKTRIAFSAGANEPILFQESTDKKTGLTNGLTIQVGTLAKEPETGNTEKSVNQPKIKFDVDEKKYVSVSSAPSVPLITDATKTQ